MQIGLRVIAHPTIVCVDQSIDLWAFVLNLKHLIHLLLIFADDKARFGMFQDVLHLLCNGILVNRDRNRAERLCSNDRPIKARPIVTNNRNAIAAFQAQRFKATSNTLDLASHFSPGPSLPDSEILLAHGRAIRPLLCVPQEKLRSGVVDGKIRIRCHRTQLLRFGALPTKFFS